MINIMLGVISCLADNTLCLDERIKMHRKQLDKFSEYATYMNTTYGYSVGEIPLFRVEQGWSAERQQYLDVATIPLRPIRFSEPIPPGAARNELLEILYQSDYDWLVCFDDDHSLITTYAGQEFLWELSEPPFLELAKQGYMINAIPGYHSAYNALIQNWGLADTHWLLRKTTHFGALAVCCIPNLVKFGRKPVYFDAHTTITETGAPPEDLKFAIDWLVNGGKAIECWQLISTATGDLQKSSIFKTEDDRRRKIKEYAEQWITPYLRSKYPRNPALWTKKGLLDRRNPDVQFNIPRLHQHQF